MANKERGEVKITLNGKEITLVPSYENFVEIESALDICLFDLTQNMAVGKCSLKDLTKSVEILSGEKNIGNAIFKEGYPNIMVKVGEALVIGIAGNPSKKEMEKEKN
jgi:hypothetical protein